MSKYDSAAILYAVLGLCLLMFMAADCTKHISDNNAKARHLSDQYVGSDMGPVKP